MILKSMKVKQETRIFLYLVFTPCFGFASFVWSNYSNVIPLISLLVIDF